MLAPALTAFLPNLLPEVRSRLLAIPGVRIVTRAAGPARVEVAWHAVPILDAQLRADNVEAYGAAWQTPPPTPVEWSADEYDCNDIRRHSGIRADLEQAGEVKPWVLDFLTPYQRDALCFCGPRHGSLTHHPTGAGKTLTSVCWALLAPGPVVIVTRAASRVQFAGQVERFASCLAYACKPAANVRKRDRFQTLSDYLAWCREKQQRPVVVVGWESLPDQLDALLAIAPVSLVMDESHKGKSAKRWEAIPLPEGDGFAAAVRDIKARGGFVKPALDGGAGGGPAQVGIVPRDNIAHAIMRLAQRATRRLATTATPISDRVRDLYGQLDLLEPGAWGTNSVWMHRYAAAKPGMYGGLDTTGMSNAPELAERLRYVIHHVDYTVTHAQLPRKRRESYYIAREDQCEPSGGFAKWAKEALAAGPGAVLEVQLAEAASRKRKAVLSRMEDHVNSGHKLVVFTARRRDCDELADAVRGAFRALVKGRDGESRKVQVWGAHGGNDQAEREQIKAEYMASEGPCVLVGTGDAWGTSIDGLQCTDAAFFVLLPYTPGQLTQWEGRFSRLGQDRPVVIYYCIAEGTVDEHVADILINKLSAVETMANDGAVDGMSGALSGIAGHESEILDSILAKIGASP